jgi:hypothetical protein
VTPVAADGDITDEEEIENFRNSRAYRQLALEYPGCSYEQLEQMWLERLADHRSRSTSNVFNGSNQQEQ